MQILAKFKFQDKQKSNTAFGKSVHTWTYSYSIQVNTLNLKKFSNFNNRIENRIWINKIVNCSFIMQIWVRVLTQKNEMGHILWLINVSNPILQVRKLKLRIKKYYFEKWYLIIWYYLKILITTTSLQFWESYFPHINQHSSKCVSRGLQMLV